MCFSFQTTTRPISLIFLLVEEVEDKILFSLTAKDNIKFKKSNTLKGGHSKGGIYGSVQ